MGKNLYTICVIIKIPREAGNNNILQYSSSVCEHLYKWLTTDHNKTKFLYNYFLNTRRVCTSYSFPFSPSECTQSVYQLLLSLLTKWPRFELKRSIHYFLTKIFNIFPPAMSRDNDSISGCKSLTTPLTILDCSFGLPTKKYCRGSLHR